MGMHGNAFAAVHHVYTLRACVHRAYGQGTMGDSMPSEMVVSTANHLGVLGNGPLVAALIAFATAQILKFVLAYFETKRLDYTRLWGPGGMPSSHTAFVTGLTTAVLVRDGSGSTAFAVCFVLAAVTMYDATGVRWHLGRTATVVNALVGEFPPEHPIYVHERLRDQMGHTPQEVAAGAALGVALGATIGGLYMLAGL
ncbi:hypothetical protein FOA52_007672 [Chlamydomonas sp. UWO 241]|nr:hypothetical protein FOA52_007672 [Chlamydomonas sp. UWO 241]